MPVKIKIMRSRELRVPVRVHKASWQKFISY
jgi:hypothetical protein